MPLPLLLASSSTARQQLLTRLQQPFVIAHPAIDETPQPLETPIALVERLSRAKGLKIAETVKDHLIISSDQVIVIAGHAVSKPESHVEAIHQLQAASGSWVESLTGLALFNPQTGKQHYQCVSTQVLFKPLSLSQIERYLQQDQPYHCAGSLRVESLGISLLAKIVSDDPTALIGLPLIGLVDFLTLEAWSFP